MTMQISLEQLDECLELVAEAVDRIPDANLLGGERMVLAGNLFPEAPGLVAAVVHALKMEPELFADVPLKPEALQQRQRRAQCWRSLQSLLTMLAKRAGDAYLLDQAAAIQDAMTVVRQVRADEERPYPHPRHEERASAMQPAEEVLADRQDRKERWAQLKAKHRQRVIDEVAAEGDEKIAATQGASMATPMAKTMAAPAVIAAPPAIAQPIAAAPRSAAVPAGQPKADARQRSAPISPRQAAMKAVARAAMDRHVRHVRGIFNDRDLLIDPPQVRGQQGPAGIAGAVAGNAGNARSGGPAGGENRSSEVQYDPGGTTENHPSQCKTPDSSMPAARQVAVDAIGEERRVKRQE